MATNKLPPPETWEDLLKGYADEEGEPILYSVQDVKTALLQWVLMHGKNTVQVQYINDTTVDALWGEFHGDYQYPLLDVVTDASLPELPSGEEWFALSPTGEKFFNLLEEQ